MARASGAALLRCAPRPSVRLVAGLVAVSTLLLLAQRHWLVARLLRRPRAAPPPWRLNTTAATFAPPPGACRRVGPRLNITNATAAGIPFILHQTYADARVPEQYIRLMAGCQRLNPHFLHLLWTDADGARFVRRFYPGRVALFNKYSSGVQRSDFLRLLLLYHFGGVYIDMDVECVRPLATSLDSFRAGCVLDREREMQTRLRWNRLSTAMNSAMMARPRHPFIKFLLDSLPGSLRHKNVMWRTGPFFLDRQLRLFSRSRRRAADSVVVAPASAFSPLLDPSLFSLLHFYCEPWRRRSLSSARRLACDEWARRGRRGSEPKSPPAGAVLVHRFLHLAYPYNSARIRRRVDSCAALPRLARFEAG